jgi:hypothetical protein
MKNFILTVALMLSGVAVNAQVEIGANPIALLWGYVLANVELNIGEDWGVGGDILAGEGGGAIYLTGKHFFNPKYGCDKFNIGAFVGGGGAVNENDGQVGVGFLFGYKAVSRKKIVFDMAFGGGRGIGEGADVIGYLRFNIGYRFGLKKE